MISVRKKLSFLRTTFAGFLLLAFVLSGVFSSSAHAYTYGGGNVQGYASDGSLVDGNIVVLDEEKAKTVRVAKKDQAKNIFGVTVNTSYLPITISNSDLENEVFVAVSGTYNALVSTEGGEIKEGDYLTLSSVNGVVMRAGTDEVTVVGRANVGFNGKNGVLGSTDIKNVEGKIDSSVKLGSIPVTVDIRRNPDTKTTKVNVPDFLQTVGQAIADKEVSPIRMYLSTGIAVVSLIAAIVVIYAGIRNSVISIGRNPMSKKSIFRALVEVILTGFLILIIGIFAVYLLLRL